MGKRKQKKANILPATTKYLKRLSTFVPCENRDRRSIYSFSPAPRLAREGG
jgi:hypothetical protein